MKRIFAVIFLLLSATTAWAQPPGAITIAGKQMGASVTGEFKRFSADIQFDPAKPADGKVTVEVDTASIDIGLEDFNYELRSKTWFDSKGHPKATFVSNAVKPVGADKLEVSGKLTIKGKTQDVTVPVALKTEGANRTFEGALTIKRTDFNVGEGEWKATDTVADDVQIRFSIVTPVTAESGKTPAKKDSQK